MNRTRWKLMIGGLGLALGGLAAVAETPSQGIVSCTPNSNGTSTRVAYKKPVDPPVPVPAPKPAELPPAVAMPPAPPVIRELPTPSAPELPPLVVGASVPVPAMPPAPAPAKPVVMDMAIPAVPAPAGATPPVPDMKLPPAMPAPASPIPLPIVREGDARIPAMPMPPDAVRPAGAVEAAPPASAMPVLPGLPPAAASTPGMMIPAAAPAAAPAPAPASKPTPGVSEADKALEKKLKVMLHMGDERPRFEVKDGDETYLKVVSDHVDVKSPGSAGANMSTMKANGAVTFVTPGGEGTCQELTVVPGTGQVIVTGQVSFTYNWGKVETTVSGEKMVFRLGSTPGAAAGVRTAAK